MLIRFYGLVNIFQYTKTDVGSCHFFRTENGEPESGIQYTGVRIQVKLNDKHKKTNARKTGRQRLTNRWLTEALIQKSEETTGPITGR